MKYRPITAAVAASLFTLATAFPAQALDKSSLSTVVKPCDDFYAYANEGWLKSATIPADRSSWGAFAEIKSRNDKVLKAAIEEAVANPSKVTNPAIKKVAAYFASGLDTTTIEASGIAPLSPILDRIAALKDRAALAGLLGELNRTGFVMGASIGVSSDAKDRTRYLVQVVQGGLGLPERDYYFRTDKNSQEVREAYLKFTTSLLQMAGDSPDVAAARAKAAYKMEEALAKASMTAVQQRDPKAIYNKMTFEQLNAKAPGLNWGAYFLAQKLGQPPKVVVAQSVNPVRDLGYVMDATMSRVPPAEVNVAQPLFAKELARLAKTAPLADWQSYMRVRALTDASPKLSKKFEDAHFAFYGKKLEGKLEPRPRAERVIDEMSGNYGEAPLAEGLGQLFVEKAFSPEAKARALEMTTNIKAALRDRIQSLDWMQPETKKAALKKLDAMALQIGYPDKWKDLSPVEVSNSDYLGNWMRTKAFDNDWWAAKLGKPVDRTQWWMSPHLVNAYAGEYNEIVFPAGILQPPFFDAKLDDAVNYGGIGMVIGHEITHHFDDQGRQFDEAGNLKEWWTKKDSANYNKRADELVKQYNGYTGPNDIHVNGKLTLGENLADLGGLNISYQALQKSFKGTPPAPIDGLTANQRFFLGYAQSWRALSRPEAETKQIQTNEHSPARYRVKGPIANMQVFADAFSCPATAPAMRPVKDRIVIW
jgi:predicted metalloendopeptidase